jgi:hypothetical protein
MSGILRYITCALCKQETPKRGPAHQKYCLVCSEIKARDRLVKYDKHRDKLTIRGEAISKENRASFGTIDYQPNLLWLVKIAIPFSWASSKNHIYSTSGECGHVGKRKAKKEFQDHIVRRLKPSIAKMDIKHNKLWVSIFIQKPNHRGDAINVLDTICDAVKIATGIDDRWFSIKNLDWQIVKNNPLIFITIGQENVEHVRACSSCGRLLTFDNFQSNKSDMHGISRNCKLCCRDEDRARRPLGVQRKKKLTFVDLFS